MTLTVGNAIATALRLYRSRFAEFLVISLKATLWLAVPFLVLLLGGIGIAGMAIAAAQASRPETIVFSILGLGILLLVVYLALLFFCGAKSFTNEALIARLSFLELSAKPETVKQGWQQIRKRMWHIWLARFMVGIVVGAASFGVSIASDFLGGFLVLIFGEALLAQLLQTVLGLLSYVLQLWLSARFLLPDVSVALEKIPGDEGITRSWNLTQGKDFLIMGTILVAGLMTVPGFIICFLPFILFLIANSQLFATIPKNLENPNFPSFDPAIWQSAIAPGLLWLGVSLLLISCLTVLYTPFWQAIRGVIYYDVAANSRPLQNYGNDPNF
jgi:hypothetical protein